MPSLIIRPNNAVLIRPTGQTVIFRGTVAPATGGGGSGDVVGPASAASGRLASFSGTTGKLIADSGIATAAVVQIPAGDNEGRLVYAADAGGVSLADATINGVSLEVWQAATSTTPQLISPAMLGAVAATVAQGALADTAVQPGALNDLVEAIIDDSIGTAPVEDWEAGVDNGEYLVSPAKVAAAIAALGGGGGGLSHFTESQSTASPNATVYVDALAAGGATTNVDVALVPKGSGAFILSIPDGTTTGGNKRGAGAVCLVTSRTNAAYGATGMGSFAVGPDSRSLGQYSVAIGYNCAATQANGSVAIGYSCNATGEFGSVSLGYLNTASGLSSAAIGIRCVASGVNSLATGSQSTTRSITGARAHSSGRRSADGDRQRIDHVVSATTTSTSATTLTSTAGAVAASNVMVLPNNSGAHVRAYVTAYRSGGGVGSWEICGTIERGANAASTALVGATTIRTFGVSASLGATAVDVIADTTQGAAVVQVTAGNTDTVYWVAELKLIQAA